MTETERYKAAWRARAHRQWWYMAMLAGLVALMVISEDLVVGAVGLVGMLLATHWFNQFRCPRCGKVFNPDWAREVSFFTGKVLHCSHCGLELDEIPGETKP